MFTTKIEMNPSEANPNSKTGVMLAINVTRDVVIIDTIPDVGIVLYVMNRRGEVTKAAQYWSMKDMWLDCIPMMYLEEWQIQVDAWLNLFSNYLEDEAPEPTFLVLGDL